MGNKSSNSYLDRQASREREKTAGGDFDALYIPRTIITIAAGLAAGVFIAVISVSLLQQQERPSHLHGMQQCSVCCQPFVVYLLIRTF